MTDDMAEETTEDDPDGVTSLLREARLVFGAVLVDGVPRIVERLDEDHFEANEAEMVLSTAYASVSADLAPFVTDEDRPVDAPDGGEGGGAGTPENGTRDEDDALDRITTVDGTVDAVTSAHTYYLLCNLEAGEWKRIRDAGGGDELDSDAGAEVPAANRYLVSDALVEEATERIGALPDSVTGTEIELIDWSG